MKRAAVLMMGASSFAWGHEGELIAPHDLWRAWTFEPGIVSLLSLMALLYGLGVRTSRGARPFQILCFAAGWTVLLLALLSPIHPLGEALFSAHMAQHEMLMVIAAPLIVLSRPLTPILWALPFTWRRGLGQWAKKTPVRESWRFLTRPMSAWWIHAAAIWLWHLPALFEQTIESDVAHTLQHFSFFGSALLFWWSLFHAYARTGRGASFIYVFTTAIHTSVLGALLTFAPTVWYSPYLSSTAAWGLTPIQDQQIGGLLMWIPAGLVYLAAGLVFLALWMRESETSAMQKGYARRGHYAL